MLPKNQPGFLKNITIPLRVKTQIAELCFAVDYFSRGQLTADFCTVFDRFLQLTEEEGYKNGTLDRIVIAPSFNYRINRPQIIFDTINELIAILAKTENELARDILCTAFKNTVLLHGPSAKNAKKMNSERKSKPRNSLSLARVRDY